MSYIDVNDDNILDDINIRKEFQMLSSEHKHTEEKNIIPYFMLKREMAKGRYLRLRSYQLFGRNFINPNTPYTRLMVLHDMGTGKTTTGISIAMEFIRYFKQSIKTMQQPYVYIIGFTRAQFERDLFRFTEFGFITRAEQQHMAKLRQYAQTGSETDIATYKDFQIKIRRRLGNQKGNGFIKFIGYRELANHVFISNKNVTKMSEAEITSSIADGSLVIDYEYISKFENCLFLCDEIHNVYNSLAKNNWGVAIQIILNKHANHIRAVFLSGTILKNSQTEIVDVLNLIAGSNEQTFTKSDFFDSDSQLLPNAIEQISKHVRGRVSFLVDVNPSRYPSQSYVGKKMPGSKYLSFVRTTMPKLQNDTYMAVKNDDATMHEHAYIFDMVFPSPTGKLGIFKSSQLRALESTKEEWRKKMGLTVDSKTMTIGGDILHMRSLVKYSSKYPKMLEILDKTRATGDGKSFIYHKFVHMTGIYLIGNILASNGYLSLNAPPGDSTKCALCKHTTHAKSDHTFTPARYILIHGEMNKKSIVRQLDMFNSKDNADGSKIMIVVGSRVMREAYDLDSVRNEIIVTRPDNVPSLLQIIARGVRAGSHQSLLSSKQNVKVYILTSSTADGKMTYEENKYVQKVRDYIVIQHIEKALHITALDAAINRGYIEPALVKDDVGHLYFDPDIKVQDNLRPEDMNMSTFNVYHKEYEVVDLVYIIKRLFMEHSRIWSHDDLWKEVRNPPFDFEYDPSLFAYESFVIALERLIWADDYFTNIEEKTVNILDILQDESDKRIMLAGRLLGTIVQIDKYYIAFPINTVTMRPNIHIDAPFRIKTSEQDTVVDVSKYTQSILSVRRFNDLKIKFMAEFKNKPISQMTDAICVHGPDFHILLIEEIVSYVFDLWTNPKKIASNEFNAFYFQMLYYYDVMGLIVWMNSARNSIRDMYADFDNIINVNEKSSSVSLIPKKYKQQNRGDLIHIARSIEKSGCSWCPDTTKTRYDNAILKSKDRFTKLSRANVKATDDIVPIGHFIDNVPRFYHPERGWFSSPEYTQTDINWKENDTIIGFDTQSVGGLHIRFKLRNPKQKIKHHKDSRLAERGIICTSRSKPFLLQLIKKLNIKSATIKDNVTTMCTEIRARLMYLELIERAKGSTIKWYYNQFEDGADLT